MPACVLVLGDPEPAEGPPWHVVAVNISFYMFSRVCLNARARFGTNAGMTRSPPFANLTPSFLHPDLDTEVLERPVAMLAHAAHCCANLLSQFMTA
jgi:hypothetical protein